MIRIILLIRFIIVICIKWLMKSDKNEHTEYI